LYSEICTLICDKVRWSSLSANEYSSLTFYARQQIVPKLLFINHTEYHTYRCIHPFDCHQN